MTIGESVSWINYNAFANCQQLSDVYCLAENVPSTDPNAFNNSYIEYATLFVPSASLNNYLNVEPWKNFKNKVALESGDTPAVEKCATPTITFENGKIKFSCQTEGVEYVSEITTADIKTYYDGELTPTFKYNVSVYATKAGYENSDTATMEITASGKLGDLNSDGKVDVADHVKLSDIIMNQKE